MDADLISHADGRRFIREGACDGCKRHDVKLAQCCTFLNLPLQRALSDDERMWVELHPGLEVKAQTVNFNVACSALNEDGTCSLFGLPERPAMCVRFPELPEQVLEGCAYSLTEVK